MILRLIKGSSYTAMDGLHATRKNPFVEVEDIKRASALIDSGYFEAVAEKKADAKAQDKQEDDGLPYEEVKTPTAAETLKAELESMKVGELKQYAAQKGVELKSSKKEDIIEALMEADAKAQEARESLRGE